MKPLILWLVIVGCAPELSALPQRASERLDGAIVVIGRTEPMAFLGFFEFNCDLRSDSWDLVDELLSWYGRGHGHSGGYTGRGPRLRILLASIHNNFEIPVSDLQVAALQLRIHLQLEGHEVDGIRIGDLHTLSSARLSSYDVVINWGYSTTLVPDDLGTKIPLITLSLEHAIRRGLVERSLAHTRSHTVCIAEVRGPYSRLTAGERVIDMESTWHYSVRVGAAGRGLVFESCDGQEAGQSNEPVVTTSIPAGTAVSPQIAKIPDSVLTDEHAVVILSEDSKRAFFGYYRSWDYDSESWKYLDALVEFMTTQPLRARRLARPTSLGLAKPRSRILLFGYSNDYIPEFAFHQEPSYLLFVHLLLAGYEVDTRPQTELSTTPLDVLQSYDLIIYWNSFSHSLNRVLASGVPFITQNPDDAITMGIADRQGWGLHWQSTICVETEDGPYRRFDAGVQPISSNYNGTSWSIAMRPTSTARGVLRLRCPSADKVQRQSMGKLLSRWRN